MIWMPVISDKSVVRVQKRKALASEKKHRRLIHAMRKFSYIPGFFELLQSLLGRFFSALEIEGRGMCGGHDAGLEKATKNREVTFLKVDWVRTGSRHGERAVLSYSTGLCRQDALSA
jgi:hypothetical protein